MTIVIKSTSDKESIKKALSSLENKGRFKALKYCGKINLKEDPLVIQKKLRDEWQ
jgi:hypothetical protein